MNCDVCIIGGGAGGFGSALAAARAGTNVVLVETQPILGGTSTSAFVANWEPGPGCSFAREVCRRLETKDRSMAVAVPIHRFERDEPYGIALGINDAQFTYSDSLRRANVPPERQCRVVMEPEELACTMQAMLRESGVRLLLNTTFQKAEVSDKTIRRIHCISPAGEGIAIRAKAFIDSTGGVHLCRAVGCETMLGVEPKSQFGEPSAPEKPSDFLNAISLCYRIRKAENPKRQQAPSGPVGQFGRTAFAYGISDEALFVNPLPLVAGATLVKKGDQETMVLARKRVFAHWHWLQGYPHFREYELEEIAPMLGIRESHRIVSEYILTEHDVRAGLSRQQRPDVVAVADHALDIHGGSPGAEELNEGYGIPYRCLIPKGWKNLLVACRGAGFSHIAASSCRLSRTMIALGHAAGIAAAEAARKNKDVHSIDVPLLVRMMGAFSENTEKSNSRTEHEQQGRRHSPILATGAD